MRKLIDSFRATLGRRQTFRAHFWQTAANYIQQGFAMVFGVVLARLLNPEDFGHFAFASATISLFLLPAGWSLAPLVVASAGRDPTVVSDAMRFAWRIAAFQILLSLGGCAYLFHASGYEVALLGLIVGVAQALGNIIGIQRASLEAQSQFKGNFYDSLLMATLSILICIPAALLGLGAWALVLPAVPMLVCQFLLFRHLSGIGMRPSHPPCNRRSHLRSGLGLWLASLGELIIMRADKYFLGVYSSPVDVGYYNRAFNYTPLSARILNSLMTNPTVSALARTTNGREKFTILSRTGGILLVGGVLNYLLFAWFSDPLVPWIFGEQWRSSIPVFQALAPLSLATMAAYLPATLLLAKKQYGILATSRLIVVAVFLAWAFVSADHITPVSMAYAVQISMAAQGVLFVAFEAARKLRKPKVISSV